MQVFITENSTFGKAGFTNVVVNVYSNFISSYCCYILQKIQQIRWGWVRVWLTSGRIELERDSDLFLRSEAACLAW